MNNLLTPLENLWLSSAQAQVYLVVLQSWKILVSDIAKKSGLKRTSVINYVEELLKQWFLSKTVVWKRVAYIAESPESILREFELKKKKFEKNIPELNALFLNSSQKANVIYFEWLSGIRKEYQKISTGFQPIITFFSMERYLKVLKVQDMNNFVWNIVKNQNTIKDLMEDTQASREIMSGRKFSGKSMKWLPKTFPVTIDLIIQWDRVTMISFEKLMWVTIENKEIADFHRNLHGHFWDLIK